MISNSSEETKKFGAILARQILDSSVQKKAIIIGMQGNLGAGKTTFAQGFASGLNIRERILSPTYVIFKRFSIPIKRTRKLKISKKSKLEFKNFYHFDCYRIKDSKEILDLGFVDIAGNPENVILIEWSDNIKNILPDNIIMLEFSILGKEKREIKQTILKK